MSVDQRELQRLTRTESMRLLSSVSLGRAVFTARALPAIRPVNHVVEDDAVIIRTDLGSALAGAVLRAPQVVVAYEADVIDADTHLGWSVVVTGLADVVTDPAELAGYAERLRPWAARPTDCVIRISCDLVTGYLLTAPVAA
jgi:hypothetical protein